MPCLEERLPVEAVHLQRVSLKQGEVHRQALEQEEVHRQALEQLVAIGAQTLAQGKGQLALANRGSDH
jgi:hypothetical protein